MTPTPAPTSSPTANPTTTGYWCERAWLPGGPAERVRLEATDGVLRSVDAGVDPRPGDARLPGIVLPGMANAHSHAFHRALRGWTHGALRGGSHGALRGGSHGALRGGAQDRGDFWSWRRQMYALAEVLDPDGYHRLARAVFAEMVLAGVTAVGELHYLHHPPGGGRYADPNAMAEALRAAAAEAGLHLTLLDTCYLTGDVGEPLEGTQRRFGDGDAARWAERVDLLRPDAGFGVGAAVHSVRAVPRDQVPEVVRWARDRGAPLHAHLSEQPAENDRCRAAYGVTPAQVLDDAGFLGPGSTVVHAVHVTDDDVARLGRSGTAVCLCPSTERDLGDGIAPAGALRDAGSPWCVGTDQHVTVDLLGEVCAVEMHERLATGRRGTFAPAELVTAATVAGHRALGRPDAGVLAVGARADLVAVRTDTVRTAGTDPEQVALVAGAADVDTVVVGGQVVVEAGVHRLGDVARLLADAVGDVRARAAR
ncbi:N-formimino-L-glutamate deiminase [Actinotalea ferrariae CF5-4]|uniref:N-formimino-L-glutamate deiminase n=1 Tax=Actinotalea ferrariae CF5-4 TaxID=948458 RepID=A0A021VTR4_9CELL|nr:formimidoylglutamate deiminase [Actinotalea ferrariae]EYR62457.1 N-formimino-L-glutamate deiminase [Actinotalea ferrariae CF5-4]